MRFELDENNRGFRLLQDDGSGHYFLLQKHVGTWTVGEMLELLAQATDELSEFAGTIFNYIISALQQTSNEATNREVGRNFLLGLAAEAGGSKIGIQLLKGMAEVMRYLRKNRVLARIIAVNYLKNNEMMLEPDELERRIDLFDKYTSFRLAQEAFRNFFPNTTPSSPNTGLPLKE